VSRQLVNYPSRPRILVLVPSCSRDSLDRELKATERNRSREASRGTVPSIFRARASLHKQLSSFSGLGLGSQLLEGNFPGESPTRENHEGEPREQWRRSEKSSRATLREFILSLKSREQVNL